jgi:hypothetical protein
MVLLVQIFAAFIVLMGLTLLIAPAKLVGVVTTLFDGKAGLWVAVGLRLVIGVLLVLTAPQSRFPFVFWLIGLIAIVAAVVAVVMGQDRIRNFVMWWVRKPPTFLRLWSLIAIAFGAFIFYGLT